MARPKGTKNRPGAKKTGPKGVTKVPYPELAKIKALKEQIIELLEAELADNLTEACELLGISKLRVHEWFKSDPEFGQMVRSSQEIKADRLEKRLDEMNHPVALIFRLKKLRPEYRDTYKFNVTSESLEKLLKRLAEIGERAAQGQIVEGEYKEIEESPSKGATTTAETGNI